MHSNGYSLVRRIVANSGLGWGRWRCPFGDGDAGGRRCLFPPGIYVKSALEARCRAGGVHALAHITGGGLTENLPRVLPDGLGAEIDLDAWSLLPLVFSWLGSPGGSGAKRNAEDVQLPVSGWCWSPNPETCARSRSRGLLGDAGEDVATALVMLWKVDGELRYTRVALLTARVAILISGGGSNMAALARSMTGDHPARPVLVISNEPGCGRSGQSKARWVFKTATVDHRDLR